MGEIAAQLAELNAHLGTVVAVENQYHYGYIRTRELTGGEV